MAGAAGVRFDDQLPADGKRVRSGQQVIVPTGQHIKTLTAARLAADVLGVPSLVIARTGARAASLLTSDSDERDHEFLAGGRTRTTRPPRGSASSWPALGTASG